MPMSVGVVPIALVLAVRFESNAVAKAVVGLPTIRPYLSNMEYRGDIMETFTPGNNTNDTASGTSPNDNGKSPSENQVRRTR